jgi:hypothetical protein
VLIALGNTARRWRLLLAVLALAGATGAGVVGAHSSIDAVVADAGDGHAEACALMGLVCAIGLAGVVARRAVRRQPADRRAPEAAPEELRSTSWRAMAVRALPPPPSPARLCRFLT